MADAINQNDMVGLQQLISSGGNVNRRSRLTFREPAEGFTPLHWAAYRGNAHAINLLLDAGADPLVIAGTVKATPLQLLCGRPNYSGLEGALQRLATDANVLTYRDAWGRTALQIAFDADNSGFVCELLRLGADPYQIDSNGVELFDRVIARDNVDMFKCFVDAGVDIDNVMSIDGLTSRDWIMTSGVATKIREYILGN